MGVGSVVVADQVGQPPAVDHRLGRRPHGQRPAERPEVAEGDPDHEPADRPDGFELADMIRQHPRFQKTAIIFISAVHLTDLDRIKGYQRGAVDYISVPVVPEVLRAKVSVFAELHRKTRQLESLNRELEKRVAERTEELKERADLVELASEAIMVRDSNGMIQFWNSGAEVLYGWSREEVLGKNIQPGVPLCFPLEGMAIPMALKSGNFGTEDFYGAAFAAAANARVSL